MSIHWRRLLQHCSSCLKWIACSGSFNDFWISLSSKSLVPLHSAPSTRASLFMMEVKHFYRSTKRCGLWRLRLRVCKDVTSLHLQVHEDLKLQQQSQRKLCEVMKLVSAFIRDRQNESNQKRWLALRSEQNQQNTSSESTKDDLVMRLRLVFWWWFCVSFLKIFDW